MKVICEEYDIVCQMQVIDREVFFYLAQRTDHETGLVGDKCRVSRSGIALDLSERMEPGRRRACWVINSSDVKDSLRRLCNAGLLSALAESKKGETLRFARVFFVDWLQWRQSVKKQVPQQVPQRFPEHALEINNDINQLELNKQTGSPEVPQQVPRTINITTTTSEPEKQFAMSLEWSPNETELRAMLFRSVGSKYKIEDIKPEWLADFVSYWHVHPGRQYTQSQWTNKFFQNVVLYFRDPAFVARKFGGGQSGSGSANKSTLPDWARLPKNDSDLVSWAKRNGFGEADSGDGFAEFRAKLQRKINQRLSENNLQKVSW